MRRASSVAPCELWATTIDLHALGPCGVRAELGRCTQAGAQCSGPISAADSLRPPKTVRGHCTQSAASAPKCTRGPTARPEEASWKFASVGGPMQVYQPTGE